MPVGKSTKDGGLPSMISANIRSIHFIGAYGARRTSYLWVRKSAGLTSFEESRFDERSARGMGLGQTLVDECLASRALLDIRKLCCGHKAFYLRLTGFMKDPGSIWLRRNRTIVSERSYRADVGIGDRLISCSRRTVEQGGEDTWRSGCPGRREDNDKRRSRGRKQRF